MCCGARHAPTLPDGPASGDRTPTSDAVTHPVCAPEAGASGLPPPIPPALGAQTGASVEADDATDALRASGVARNYGADMSAVPGRRAPRPSQLPPIGLELPSARYGIASVVAIAGTGRLRRLARALAGPQLVPRDPYGYIAGLEAGRASLRRDGVP